MSAAELRRALEQHALRSMSTDRSAVERMRSRLWRALGDHVASRPWRSPDSPTAATDGQLVSRLRAGDRAAFDALFERHLPTLLGYAGRTLQPASAEDAVQSALLDFVRKAHAIPDQASLLPYLLGFVRTLVVREHARRVARDLGGALDADTEPADDAQALAELIHAEERERVVAALDAVCNPLECEVVLAVLEGLAPGAIGARLELAPGHVSVVKHRAVRKLRERLGADR